MKCAVNERTHAENLGHAAEAEALEALEQKLPVPGAP